MNCPHLAKPLQGWERAQSMKLWYDSSWRCSPLRNRHPEPNGSRWATPTSLFQHRPGHPHHPRAIFLSTASPAPLAGLPGSANCPPQSLVHGFAGEPKALAQWLGQRLACPLAAGSLHRGGAKGPGLLVPARRMRAPDRLLHLGTVEAGEPVERKRHRCRLSLRGETGPEPASHIDKAKLRPREVREQRRGALAHGLLKHQIIALQAQSPRGHSCPAR